MRLPQAPTVAVLAVTGAGMAVASRGHWRVGTGLIALALLLAGGLRLVLPPRAAGWLVVRSRAFDAALLVALGAGVLGLALSVPRPV